jgi:glycosyltransferase involved in cell wall biosynthesis
VELVHQVCRVISVELPAVVVIQNFLVPALERRVFDAAERADAKVIFVVHDHRLHSRLAGLNVGLDGLVRRATVVVAHSRFVAEEIARKSGRTPVVLPLPIPLTVVEAGRATPLLPPPGDGRLRAVEFGTLTRRYKGGDTFRQVAALADANRWEFASVGVGATSSPQVEAVTGFVSPGELVTVLESSRAVLLPYRFATQSGAVALSQALGRVAIASAVGGIPEQIADGVNGLLLPPRSRPQAWNRVLQRLEDPDVARRLGERAAIDMWTRHERFSLAVRELIRSNP